MLIADDADHDNDKDYERYQIDHPRAGLVLLSHVVDCARMAVGRVEAWTRNVRKGCCLSCAHSVCVCVT